MKLQLDLFFGPKSRLKHEENVLGELKMLEKNGNQKINMLDSVYEDIFNNNIEDGSPSRIFATRALKWMMCARRPLLITELAEAASINDDEIKANLTGDEILQICSNFIISDQSKIARFTHLSVRKYLEKIKYILKQSHVQVAISCLICLRNPQNRIMKIRKLENNIVGYSIQFWIFHLAEIQPQDRSYDLQSLYKKLVSTDQNYSIIS